MTAITAALLVPIFVRRRFPVWAMLFALVVFSLQAILPLPIAGALLAADLTLAVLMYAVVVHGTRRISWSLLLVSEALFLAWTFLLVGINGEAVILCAAETAIMVAAAATGEVTRNRRQQLADAQERVLEAEERRDALARAAVIEERTRIAREMHDIVAHAVSTMVMQAEGARLLGTRNPAAVDEALRTIGITGREAVAELRQILGLLRESDTGTQPQPDVDALGELVGTMRSAGLDIHLVVVGEPEGISPGAALNAHRIVQEGLTNVGKHAPPGARCTVTVDYGKPGDPLRKIAVEVVNDGLRVHPAERSVEGYGIRGMRERASMSGGTVAAGPQPDGGFRVAALLPLTMSPEDLRLTVCSSATTRRSCGAGCA